MVVGIVVGVILAAQAGTLRGDPGRDTDANKVARLIRQLGDHDTFQFCYCVRAEDRPSEFATKAGDAGCGLVTFNRLGK